MELGVVRLVNLLAFGERICDLSPPSATSRKVGTRRFSFRVDGSRGLAGLRATCAAWARRRTGVVRPKVQGLQMGCSMKSV